MHIVKHVLVLLVVFLLTQAAFSQPAGRIHYNNQQLFLNGANLAWASGASFASDVGLGNPDTNRFADVMLSMHDHGGNALRWWLHTNGTVSPEFDSSTNYVIGPGTYTISDLRKVLDIARLREVGMKLCLWSFDMLRSSGQGALAPAVLNRNMLLLNDTNYTRAYINNCLIPMVNSLKGHPAIIAWEIFNEPEGMSNEFGWSFTTHVPMSSIQRFVNLCAGAIHRTDPTAQVTNGAWSFYALSDNPLAKASTELSKLSITEKQQIVNFIQQKYRTSLTPDEIIRHLQKIESNPYQRNYYSDSRLIAAGLDSAGTLDFYSVHYYSTSTPVSTSPFNNPASSFGLNKPIVVGEFAMETGKGVPLGVPNASLFETLYQLGYAGAFPWSFTDVQISSVASMLAGMQSLWDNHNADVKIIHPSGMIMSFSATPSIIEKGQSGYLKWRTSEGSTVTLDGNAVISSDSLKITPDTTTTYKLIARGSVIDSSTIKVTVLPSGTIVNFTATPINIGIGESSLLKWHVVSGSTVKLNNVTVASDDTLRVYPTGDSTFILSTVGSVVDTSRVIVRINNPLAINRALNKPVVTSSVESGAGVPVNSALAVDGNRSTRWSSIYANNQWIYVDLGQRFDVQHVVLYWEVAYGKSYTIDVSDNAQDWTTIYNTSTSDGGTDDITGISGSGRYVRMNGLVRATQWGFSLYEFEVYGIPAVAGIGDMNAKQVPMNFTLSQNYPNPFNPSTTIRYSLPHSGYVKLFVYDVLGRKIAALVDKKQDAGVCEIPFDASFLPTGIYFYRLDVGAFTQTRKMIILK
jgi:hypothetical protein